MKKIFSFIFLSTLFNPHLGWTKQPLSFDVPIYYDTKVRKWMSFFQTKGKKRFERWMRRSHPYIPSIKKILKEHNLPKDLAYLPLIESGFLPHARSHANAVGYWQFIRTTGLRYGLQVSWWVDERKDIIKSSHAASRYLSSLHQKFRDWHLVLAAYNMGENKLQKLIKKHKTHDFKQLILKKDFPKETREYVPQFIAAVMLNKYYKVYGFNDIARHNSLNYDYVLAPGGTDLVSLSEKIPIDYRKLRNINPELNHGFIPKTIREYTLKIPIKYKGLALNYLRDSEKITQ